ncbi:MAG: TorF family putative porin [Betaproteobacteria bacterium]
MKSSSRLVIATISIAILAGVTDSVQAQDKYALTGNAAVVSDYRYRGITQTRFDPALQAGADLGLPNGLYAGVWATNIKWIKDAGGKGSSEIDLYGGYKTELSKDLLLDVGVLRYQYPGNNYKQIPGTNNDNANTTELYGALSFGPATIKYSHATTSLFGYKNSKGSGYLDLMASFDLGGGWTIVPHLGRQTVDGAGNGKYSYTDYSLAVTKDWSGVLLGLSWVGTDVKDKADFMNPVNGKFTGKSGLVLSGKYNF